MHQNFGYPNFWMATKMPAIMRPRGYGSQLSWDGYENTFWITMIRGSVLVIPWMATKTCSPRSSSGCSFGYPTFGMATKTCIDRTNHQEKEMSRHPLWGGLRWHIKSLNLQLMFQRSVLRTIADLPFCNNSNYTQSIQTGFKII